MTDTGGEDQRARERREARLTAYAALRELRPELFVNPPGAAYEILLDRGDQDRVAREVGELAVAFGFPEECADIGVVYRDPYVCLVRDAVRFRSGRVNTYIRFVSGAEGGGAAVLPVLDDGRIVLLHHFRHADRDWHWEIPRGFGEPGEGGATTARRELLEELGGDITEMVRLGEYSADTGLHSGRDQLYLARLASSSFSGSLGPDAHEEGIDALRALSPDEMRAMLAEGRIHDGFTLAAWSLATARGLLDAAGGA
ncbi:NUDIX hydrolase [Streptomyces sp. NPDC046977]|uniref:NUDIX hydrolase n=1 Tax=Streptomyces sp. NPDC046977 TaxID=3154703 RepID=UPI0033F79B0F